MQGTVVFELARIFRHPCCVLISSMLYTLSVDHMCGFLCTPGDFYTRQSGMRISFDENIVMQLSYHFQNIVKISLSSKFGRYHTINIYEILAYFSY